MRGAAKDIWEWPVSMVIFEPREMYFDGHERGHVAEEWEFYYVLVQVTNVCAWVYGRLRNH